MNNRKYRLSTAQTYTLPQLRERASVAIAFTHDRPGCARIRNLGGGTMFVGIAAGDVQGPDGVEPTTYRIPPGAVDVFPMAPHQKLYASADGPDNQCSVWLSDDCGYTV